MSTNINQVYFHAIQQASFELEDLIGIELATELRQRLTEILQISAGDLSPDQITLALEAIQPYKALRERVRSYVDQTKNVRSGFDPLPGEMPWIGDPTEDARLLVCPKCGDQKWDHPMTPAEHRLCLKHRPYVYYIDSGPLPFRDKGGRHAG